MGHVFVTRAVPGDSLALLTAAGHSVAVFPEATPPSPEALRVALATADAALTMVTDRFDAALFDSAPRLRIVANMAVGYDNVDPGIAAAAGVWLTNTPGVLAETTADLAFALLLAAARNVVESDRDTRAGGWTAWSPTAFLGADIHGAVLGIIGMGEIGRAVARRAGGFEMRVIYHNRSRDRDFEARHGVEYMTFDELLGASDFVSVHAPLTDETRHLMGEAQFRQMKRTAIFVNTARGGIVDQEALVAALRDGAIAGAALDVADPEPLPLTHALFGLPNVVITPHIGSASRATRSRMARMAVENILAVLDGRQPPNAVNRPDHPR
jgi:glyoxylate reductase